MMVTGLKVSRMDRERKRFLMEPHSMASGSKARQRVMALKYCRTVQFLKAIGMSRSSSRANVSSLMGRFTMVNGMTESLRVTESKSGLMAVATKAYGFKESRLGRELKLTRMDR